MFSIHLWSVLLCKMCTHTRRPNFPTDPPRHWRESIFPKPVQQELVVLLRVECMSSWIVCWEWVCPSLTLCCRNFAVPMTTNWWRAVLICLRAFLVMENYVHVLLSLPYLQQESMTGEAGIFHIYVHLDFEHIQIHLIFKCSTYTNPSDIWMYIHKSIWYLNVHTQIHLIFEFMYIHESIWCMYICLW
jgi:hypothetical protein